MSEEFNEEDLIECEICEEEYERQQLNDDGRCPDCADLMPCSACNRLDDLYNLNYNELDEENYCDSCYECPHINLRSLNIEPSLDMIEEGSYEVDLMVTCEECGETFSLCGRLQL